MCVNSCITVFCLNIAVFFLKSIYFWILKYEHKQNCIFQMFDALQLLGYYALILVILGTIGNAIILYVSFRIKASSIFVLFRYLAICDTMALYFWNLNIFTYSVLNLDLQNYNMNSCKFGNWIQFSSLQSSAWILVKFKALVKTLCFYTYKIKLNVSLARFLFQWIAIWF